MATNTLAQQKPLRIPLAYGTPPARWSWARLDDLCTGIFDCPHSTPKLTDDGPYVVRTQDIATGVFRAEQAAHVSEDTFLERTVRATPSRGDLLYSREGTYFGVAAEVPEGVRICLGQRMVLIRPDLSTLNSRFLRYWLNSPLMAAHIHGFRDGSVAERLNLPTIRALPILVPPLPEQSRIAATLGALDDKIESNLRLRVVCRELGLARLTEEVAIGSARYNLASITSSISRGVAPQYADNDPAAPLVLNQRCVRDGWVDSRSARRMRRRNVADEKIAHNGDILVNSTGTGTLGRVGRWHGSPTFVDGHVTVVKPNHAICPPTVLAYALLQCQDAIEGLATGSTGQTELSRERLGALELELPRVGAAWRIEDELLEYENRAAQTLAEDFKLRALLNALLPELLSGRIRASEERPTAEVTE